ncbi:hypothetical protein Tco_0121613 [Tanacetum coccineum]
MNLRFLEDKPNVQGIGHEWYFDLDYLTDSFGYTRFKTDKPAGTQDHDSDSEVDEQVIVVPSFPSNSFAATTEILSQAEAADRDPAGIDYAGGVSAGSTSAGSDPAGGNPAGSFQPAGSHEPAGKGNPADSTSVSATFIPVHAGESTLPPGQSLGSSENTTRFPVPSDVCKDQLSSGIFTSSSYDDDFSATLTNLAPAVEVNPVPTKTVNTIHRQSQILGDLASPILTRSRAQKSKFGESAFIGYIQDQQRTNHTDQLHCLFACFLSQLEPTSIAKALEDPDWVAAMQEEMQQFINQKNRAIRLFLAFASYMGFPGISVDVRVPFYYGEIEEEVYVISLRLWKILTSKHVYKCGLSSVWIIKHLEHDLCDGHHLWGQPNKDWCDEFEVLMKGEFEMSAMGEMTFFLGLQVKQLPDGEEFFGQTVIYLGSASSSTILATSSTDGRVVNTAARCTFFLLTGLVSAVILSAGRLVSAPVSTLDSHWVYVLAVCMVSAVGGLFLLVEYIHAAGYDIADRMYPATSHWFLLGSLLIPAGVIMYALTHDPPVVFDSLVKQFWATATVRPNAAGSRDLVATIDGRELMAPSTPFPLVSLFGKPSPERQSASERPPSLSPTPPAQTSSLAEPFVFGPEQTAGPDNYIEAEDIDNLVSMEDDTILGGFHEESHAGPDDAHTPTADAAGRAEDPKGEWIFQDDVDLDGLSRMASGKLGSRSAAVPLWIWRNAWREFQTPLSADVLSPAAVSESADPSVVADKGKAQMPDLDIPDEFVQEDAKLGNVREEQLVNAWFIVGIKSCMARELLGADVMRKIFVERHDCLLRIRRKRSSGRSWCAAHNGTISMTAVKAMSKQQLIEEYENICRRLEKDRLLSAQYNLFRPKPAISEPPSKRQRFHPAGSAPPLSGSAAPTSAGGVFGVPDSTVSISAAMDSAGSHRASGVSPFADSDDSSSPSPVSTDHIPIDVLFEPTSGGINEFFLDSDEDEQIGMSRVAADPDSDDEVLAEILFRGQYISGAGVVVVDKLPDDEIVDPRVKVETVSDYASSPPRSRRKRRGVRSDDFLWDKPVEDFFSSESESDDDMETYIPPLPYGAFKDWEIVRCPLSTTYYHVYYQENRRQKSFFYLKQLLPHVYREDLLLLRRRMNRLTVPPSYCRDVVVAGNVIQTVQAGLRNKTITRESSECLASCSIVGNFGGILALHDKWFQLTGSQPKKEVTKHWDGSNFPYSMDDKWDCPLQRLMGHSNSSLIHVLEKLDWLLFPTNWKLLLRDVAASFDSAVHRVHAVSFDAAVASTVSAACCVAAGYIVSAGLCCCCLLCSCCFSILFLREDLSRNLELTESKPSLGEDFVPAGSSSSIPADYVSAGHVLVSADRDRIC